MTENKQWDLDALLGPNERQIKKVSWPGRQDKIVGLRVLSDEILRQCDERVREWSVKTGIPYSGLNMMSNAEYLYAWAAEVVSEALCDPEEPYQKLCKDSKTLTRSHRRDIIQILFEKYSEFCKDTLPEDPDALVQQEWDGLVDNLKKEQSAEAQKNLLMELEPSSLRNCILYMVSLLPKSTG